MKINRLVLFFILAQTDLIKSSDIPTLSISQDETDNESYSSTEVSTIEDQSINQTSNSTNLNTPNQTETKAPLQNHIIQTASSLPLNQTTLTDKIGSLKSKIEEIQKNINYLQKSKKPNDPNIIEKIKQDQKIIQKYKDQITAFEKQITKLPITSPTHSNKSLSLGKLSSNKRKSRTKRKGSF
ncbi:MAG: hypothetical protein ACXWL5_03445 [Candidatus Chromulinivorax sp.]